MGKNWEDPAGIAQITKVVATMVDELLNNTAEEIVKDFLESDFNPPAIALAVRDEKEVILYVLDIEGGSSSLGQPEELGELLRYAIQSSECGDVDNPLQAMYDVYIAWQAGKTASQGMNTLRIPTAKVFLPGVYTAEPEEFDRIVADLQKPTPPTESIRRGAELLKRLYGGSHLPAAADKTEGLRRQAFDLSCHEQFRLASFVAENLGYVLSPDPLRDAPESDVMSASAKAAETVARWTPSKQAYASRVVGSSQPARPALSPGQDSAIQDETAPQ